MSAFYCVECKYGLVGSSPSEQCQYPFTVVNCGHLFHSDCWLEMVERDEEDQSFQPAREAQDPETTDEAEIQFTHSCPACGQTLSRSSAIEIRPPSQLPNGDGLNCSASTQTGACATPSVTGSEEDDVSAELLTQLQILQLKNDNLEAELWEARTLAHAFLEERSVISRLTTPGPSRSNPVQSRTAGVQAEGQGQQQQQGHRRTAARENRAGIGTGQRQRYQGPVATESTGLTPRDGAAAEGRTASGTSMGVQIGDKVVWLMDAGNGNSCRQEIGIVRWVGFIAGQSRVMAIVEFENPIGFLSASAEDQIRELCNCRPGHARLMAACGLMLYKDFFPAILQN